MNAPSQACSAIARVSRTLLDVASLEGYLDLIGSQGFLGYVGLWSHWSFIGHFELQRIFNSVNPTHNRPGCCHRKPRRVLET